MLVSLSIRDVVLIERLDLAFDSGLSVFTGETGAGKSILLDSLGLALGARSDAGLVRHGASQLSVTAVFDPPMGHPARDAATEHGLDGNDQDLILRRVVNADGRSKAFINDHPVSVALLRQMGDHLVEIHGQFESHGLMDPATHCVVLDTHGGLGPAQSAVKSAWDEWKTAADAHTQAERELSAAREKEETLRHAFEELDALAPKADEEQSLADRRALLQQSEKLIDAMNGALQILSGDGNVEAQLRTAMRSLERVADKAAGRFDPVIAALDRAALEISEATNTLDHISADIPLDSSVLEKVEERLFALRSTARKHGVNANALHVLHKDLERQLALASGSGDDLIRLAKAEQAARMVFVEKAKILGTGRRQAAESLDRAVAGELPPLKLDRAHFKTQITLLPEDQWGANGQDKVEFLVATNPGAPPAPLAKIASGGELSRFMLALKVILAGVNPIPSIVFDEVDSGIGGAVASAVGERLGRLGETLQVLVVTHSPQVAARGNHHFQVAKSVTAEGKTITAVAPLSAPERREEVARMLAGETVTDQARAAAESLLGR